MREGSDRASDNNYRGISPIGFDWPHHGPFSHTVRKDTPAVLYSIELDEKKCRTPYVSVTELPPSPSRFFPPCNKN